MRQPIIIDVLGSYANDLSGDLQRRSASYGAVVSNLTSSRIESLHVYSRSIQPYGQTIQSVPGLTIRSIGLNRNPWLLGKMAARLAEDCPNPVTWIAATPFREAISCFAAAQLVPGRLQVQAHGDFGRLKPFRGGARNQLRWLMAQKSFRAADSVRAVSPQQLIDLVTSYNLNEGKCIVAPVPINQSFVNSQIRHLPTVEFPRVGFFGRIHKERGIDLWSRVAGCLYDNRTDIKFDIIGSGPHATAFKRLLLSKIPPDNITFHGDVYGEKLIRLISQLSLVINTCQVETYGRATVESLSLGIPVVAIRSPGSIFIEQTFQPAHLHIVEGENIASLALASLSDLPKNQGTEIGEKIREFEADSIKLLVESWL